MPTPAYISIIGVTQGSITAGAFTAESVGNIYVEGHEDEILVQEIKHNIKVPTDVQSGQPSGQRVHAPFIFTCTLNKSTPLMYNALTSGEALPKVVIKWYRTSIDGKQEHFFSTKLTDAIIVGINLIMPNTQNSAYNHFTQLLKVTMTYRKVDWEHTIAGTSGSDDWRAPIEV